MRRHHGRRRGGGRPRKPLMFGTTKVGERGQIVIPKEAREEFDIKPGDSLFVIGDTEKQGLAIVKADLLEGFALQILQGIGYFNRGSDNEDEFSDDETGSSEHHGAAGNGMNDVNDTNDADGQPKDKDNNDGEADDYDDK